jgi:pimeloyl-ACP methyl ester carboxylesterase
MVAAGGSSAFAPTRPGGVVGGGGRRCVPPSLAASADSSPVSVSADVDVDADAASSSSSSSSSTTTMTTTTTTASVLEGYDHRSSIRLPYSPTGYSTWEWKTRHGPPAPSEGGRGGGPSPTTASHSINYVEQGDPSRPAILLVHGFGASSYHWRHNIPVLAREYHVYAIDLLGFGWSDKPIMDYDASVWRDQIVDFVKEEILKDDDDRYVAIAGNSLGGFAAMYAAADVRIKDRVGGCVLLNAAGRFRDPSTEIDDGQEKEAHPIVRYVTSAMQRFVIACSFVYTKRPERIEQILRQVYPVDDANVDGDLVSSIYAPALDGSAAEVFYRVIAKNGSGPNVFVDDVLRELHCPVLLAWGESDPWIRPSAADRMVRLHADFHGDNENSVGGGGENGGRRWIRRVSIDAGHCPHDEAPGAVNDAILTFANEVLGSVR